MAVSESLGLPSPHTPRSEHFVSRGEGGECGCRFDLNGRGCYSDVLVSFLCIVVSCRSKMPILSDYANAVMTVNQK